MTEKHISPRTQQPGAAHGQELRERAEALLRETAGRIPPGKKTLTGDEVREVLHELHVHQIELEMQNEELRRTQAELDVSRARYFDLYDLAPLGYFTLGEKGLVSEANLTAAILLGVVRSALVKQPLSRFIHRDDADRYYLLLRKAENFPEQRSGAFRMVRSDGTEFHGHLTVSLSEDKGQAEYRVVLGDITELKQLEREKEKLEILHGQRLKSESLDRMAAAVAHHFNNQLQAIMMSLELADRSLSRNSAALKPLDMARKAAVSAAEVSTQMLSYLGRSLPALAPLDLAAACRGSLAQLQSTKLPEAEIAADLPNPGPAIRSDESLIRQVVTNLLTNACEACHSRSDTIRIAVKTVTATAIATTGRIPLDWQPRDPAYACLEVADSGCGIAVADLELLFDPFYTTKFTGRGLGLTVALGIVRAHGGAITVESTPGKGSIFRVYFPLTKETPAPRPDRAAPAPDSVAGPDKKVLVVDDDLMVRQSVADALELSGFSVVTAVDGVDALEKFQANPDEFSCVLCDLTMPRMNGWDTLTALRRLSPSLPVILASGFSEAQAMEGRQSERPHAFLQKPFAHGTLIKAISEVAARK